MQNAATRNFRQSNTTQLPEMDKKLMAENLCGYTIELVQCDTDTCGIPPTEEIVGLLRLVKLQKHHRWWSWGRARGALGHFLQRHFCNRRLCWKFGAGKSTQPSFWGATLSSTHRGKHATGHLITDGSMQWKKLAVKKSCASLSPRAGGRRLR